MKHKTRFKNFGNIVIGRYIGIGLKKALSVDLYMLLCNHVGTQ